jgi:DNA-binding NarL/FixJ family response regulator
MSGDEKQCDQSNPMHATPNIPGPVWVVSENPEVCLRISGLLSKYGVCHKEIAPTDLDADEAWGDRWTRPPLIVLDVDHKLDRGRRHVQKIYQRYPEMPVVILTSDFSREFGSKILSQGVLYYFSYDFLENEFKELMGSLLHLAFNR